MLFGYWLFVVRFAGNSQRSEEGEIRQTSYAPEHYLHLCGRKKSILANATRTGPEEEFRQLFALGVHSGFGITASPLHTLYINIYIKTFLFYFQFSKTERNSDSGERERCTICFRFRISRLRLRFVRPKPQKGAQKICRCDARG